MIERHQDDPDLRVVRVAHRHHEVVVGRVLVGMAHSLRAAGRPARVHDRPGVARVDFDLGWLGVAARHRIVERLGERR